MKSYKAVGKIGEGTFSEVTKMQSLRDGGYYACKQMKQRFESIEHVNNLREIQALRRLNPHPNILTLHEVVFDRKSGSLALICELMDMNIYELIRGRRHPLSEKKIMHYMYQLCKSLDHMHRNGIFHRDVKPENILIKQDVLKLGDFGSCRSVYSKQPYTEYISTRWYRAPECLLTDGFYTYKMDLWSAGCVFYEIASLQPLFPGADELDQISKIHDVIGTPPGKTLAKFTQAAEKQALAGHRRAFFPERPVASELLSNRWHVAEEDSQQKQSLKPEEDHPKRPGPAYVTELPRLKLSGVTEPSSYPSPALHPVFGPGPGRKVLGLRPLEGVGARQKVAHRARSPWPTVLRPAPPSVCFLRQTDAHKDTKPDPKQYCLPSIQRKGGGR
ncbi:MAPK/MAK/MRK overlapping kinase isoform X4 [Mustela lutreola]|uniref:MAPK/MAK/MRK overlapping kinase isoform X4 n=1 Tax=Mustela lutreola TaxID=9666 RepID=UPI00279747C8|nr:MAPK/MAK/MRK overlapping kinase isoform X4 [Mustela lutreola]